MLGARTLNLSAIYKICMLEDIRLSLKPGMIVKVYQRIREKNAKGEEKERIQIFEGTVLAVKHGSQPGATATVRKISKGIGVEKIFPIHSPVVEKIELVREMKVRQANAFFLRDYKKKLREIRKPNVDSKPKVGKKEEKAVENKVEEVVAEPKI